MDPSKNPKIRGPRLVSVSGGGDQYGLCCSSICCGNRLLLVLPTATARGVPARCKPEGPGSPDHLITGCANNFFSRSTYM